MMILTVKDTSVDISYFENKIIQKSKIIFKTVPLVLRLLISNKKSKRSAKYVDLGEETRCYKRRGNECDKTWFEPTSFVHFK